VNSIGSAEAVFITTDIDAVCSPSTGFSNTAGAEYLRDELIALDAGGTNT